MPDSNYTINRLELVKKALRRVGNTTPTEQEIIDATSMLNLLIKRIDIDGKWLWTIDNTPTALNTVGSQKSYAVGTPPVGIPDGLMGIESIWYETGNSRTYLRIVEKEQFLRSVHHETSSSTPAEAYFESKPDDANNLLWILPAPSGVYNLKYHGKRRLYDFDNPSDNPDFPTEWVICLILQLANMIAPEYDVKLDERSLLKLEAEEELKKMTSANSEYNKEDYTKAKFY